MPIRTAVVGFGLAGQVFHAPFLTTDDAYALELVVTATEQENLLAAAEQVTDELRDPVELTPRIGHEVLVPNPKGGHAAPGQRVQRGRGLGGLDVAAGLRDQGRVPCAGLGRIDATGGQERMGTVPGWSLEGASLTRAFEFPDFVRAFGFMASVAAIAQAMDHHPDWANVYNRVTIRLSTHDAGGLTNRDFEMAARIGELIASD